MYDVMVPQHVPPPLLQEHQHAPQAHNKKIKYYIYYITSHSTNTYGVVYTLQYIIGIQHM